jgi:hypothetical protein
VSIIKGDINRFCSLKDLIALSIDEPDFKGAPGDA